VKSAADSHYGGFRFSMLLQAYGSAVRTALLRLCLGLAVRGMSPLIVNAFEGLDVSSNVFCRLCTTSSSPPRRHFPALLQRLLGATVCRKGGGGDVWISHSSTLTNCTPKASHRRQCHNWAQVSIFTTFSTGVPKKPRSKGESVIEKMLCHWVRTV